MDSARPFVCPQHGESIDPRELVGRAIRSVVASWHHFPGRPVTGPLSVWLIDADERVTHITVSSDWCLLVAEAEPVTGFDMGEYGRIEAGPIGDATPFAPHLGATVDAVREEHDPMTGRVALELTFATGRVRCDMWSGDLRLTALPADAPPPRG
jgi:hypothetical protein